MKIHISLSTTKYRYAMVNRPAGYGACPKDFVGTEPRPTEGKDHHEYARNGVVVYNRRLTDHETQTFELAPMLDGKDRDEVAKLVAADMREYRDEYIKEAAEHLRDFMSTVMDRIKSTTKGYPPSVGGTMEFAQLVLKHLKGR